jgi:hypothetical protein
LIYSRFWTVVIQLFSVLKSLIFMLPSDYPYNHDTFAKESYTVIHDERDIVIKHLHLHD